MRAFHSHLIALVLAMPALSACGKSALEAPQAGAEPSLKVEALARRAITDPSLADELRAEGPAGLTALLAQAKAANRLDATLDPLIDHVAGQRYARYSGLYWYTNLDDAVERAAAEHKPILSLRMLGDLRDDLSCANSRYFRVVLYPDPVLGAYLRQGFVLHWSSERPVPKITVDYGDGRKLVRTITGNSIHYVLDSHGRVVDAIPGLMAAPAFRTELERAGTLAAEVSERSDADYANIVRARHARDELTLLDRWQAELAAVGVRIENRDVRELATQNARLRAALNRLPAMPAFPAYEAVELAATKAIPERKLVQEITGETMPKTTFSVADAKREATPVVWARVAARHRTEVALSEASQALMRELAPRGFDLDGHPVPMDDAGFRALVARFQDVLALDTIENQIELRVGIHQRLAAHPGDSLDQLNRWVYATVFLTPRSDPWLGLTADQGFTAIPADGIRQAAAAE